jgi:hypothetical protein
MLRSTDLGCRRLAEGWSREGGLPASPSTLQQLGAGVQREVERNGCPQVKGVQLRGSPKQLGITSTC